VTNRRVLINLAFFSVVFATMLVWAVNNVVTVEAIEQPYQLTADFDQASGILPRAEIAYLGVHYGTVAGVERIADDHLVRVTMKIDADKKLPEGSTANIFRKSAIGEPYIDFFPPDDYDGKGPFLEKGDRVPLELTTVPLEFSELLRSASRVVSGIEPDRVHVLIHELSLALLDRSDDLRQLTIASDELAQTFAERTDVLDRLATNNTRLTHVVAQHRDSFGQPISDLAALADSLRNAKGDTTVLLEKGSELLGRTADLVSHQKANLDCILGDLETVIDATTTPDKLAGLRTQLEVAPRAYGQAFNTRDLEADGLWVRVGTITNPENPPPQYVPPRETPTVPDVPPCRSDLKPSGVDYIPASGKAADRDEGGAAAGPGRSGRPPVPGLPATGGTVLLLAGLAVAAGALVVRSTTSRTVA
jgi:phospholipid/cholesterol/gamma-HCH transport system substrate-binding protein